MASLVRYNGGMVRFTPGKCWKIAGYANGKLFFERTLPYHHLTSGQAGGLIQRLAAQHLPPRRCGYSFSEVGHTRADRTSRSVLHLNAARLPHYDW